MELIKIIPEVFGVLGVPMELEHSIISCDDTAVVTPDSLGRAISQIPIIQLCLVLPDYNTLLSLLLWRYQKSLVNYSFDSILSSVVQF